MNLFLALLVFCLLNICFVSCPYPPAGDEVAPGSVLLPASRRGRYLANIVRRQAVDGTGIKFNKDADQINTEAKMKQKVDVLSDELLPFITAEQERRITLYKRIMTAIQNGEKGVTIAEIRNKPPLLIRKGAMFRCPSNRAPIEPDGSGSLICEEQIEPTQVMYDSCLSAEDRDLYVADGKYFFCNRHKMEGPDLPKSGSTVIGCAPTERTSLNYTYSKCAIEGTEDVVVHYRYYPDRSYKFVTELDPDHEVCDHWNPCQIGYIFALPGFDMAIPANELWQGYSEHFGEYERDEIVPPVPEDSYEEFVSPQSSSYTSSLRRVAVPKGYKYSKLWAKRTIDDFGWNPENIQFQCTSEVKVKDNFVAIKLKFPEQWSDFFYSTYYAVFTKGLRGSGGVKVIKFLTIAMSSAHVVPEIIQASQTKNLSTIPYKCTHCRLQSIIIRTYDGHIHNVDPDNYRIKDERYLEIDLLDLEPWQYGDYFAIVKNADGNEERLKVLSLLTPEIDENNEVQVIPKSVSLALGAKYEEVLEYKCENDPECTLNNVLCNGKSVMATGMVSLTPISKKVTFAFPSFDNSLSCVYMGEFSSGGHIYRKTLLIVEQDSQAAKIEEVKKIPVPKLGEQLEQTVSFNCESDCSVEKVTVNGVPLQSDSAVTRRCAFGGMIAVAFFLVIGFSITIRITQFLLALAGVFQATFIVGGVRVTKTIMEIGNCAPKNDNSDWISVNLQNFTDLNDKAVVAGNDGDTGSPIWVVRFPSVNNIPGNLFINIPRATFGHEGQQKEAVEFEVLIVLKESIEWKRWDPNNLQPPDAIVASGPSDKVFYIGRVPADHPQPSLRFYVGQIFEGKFHFGFGGIEISGVEQFEVLSKINQG